MKNINKSKFDKLGYIIIEKIISDDLVDNFDDNGFLFEYLSKNRVNYSFIDEVDDSRNISTKTAIMKLEEYIVDKRNK